MSGRRPRGVGGGRPTDLLAARAAWAALAVVVVVALAIGSVHRGVTSDAARIANLDGIIKCPSCEDLSIAQSDASTAVALRAVVAADVHAGRSDAQVEAYVVARYGPGVLLRPANPLVWALPIAGMVAAAGGVGAVFWRRRRRNATAPDAADEALVADALARRPERAPEPEPAAR